MKEKNNEIRKDRLRKTWDFNKNQKMKKKNMEKRK
jgi:hypothetical protein